MMWYCIPWTTNDANRTAVCSWHTRVPAAKSRFICSANRYLRQTSIKRQNADEDRIKNMQTTVNWSCSLTIQMQKKKYFKTQSTTKCGKLLHCSAHGLPGRQATVSPQFNSRRRRRASHAGQLNAYSENNISGKHRQTVSSLICDRWLMLSLETLSISCCLNHW